MQYTMFDELESLKESKAMVTKIIASYAEKQSKKDFWELWYRNAKDYYIRKARKINEEIKRIEDDIKAMEAVAAAQAQELANAEAQRRENEVPAQESAPEACGATNDAPTGQACCRAEGPCERARLVSEGGSEPQEVAGEPSTSDEGARG